jgi:MOSC domain-containing protein YiiM
MSAAFDDFEAAYAEALARRQPGTVRLVVARKGRGRHAILDEGKLTAADGLVGDRWTLKADPDAQSQITVMEAAVVEAIAGELVPKAGDNLLVDFDLSAEALPAGTRLTIGTALVEVTPEPHHGCRKFSARFGSPALKWINAKANAGRRLRGLHVRVVEDGAVKPGDVIAIASR